MKRILVLLIVLWLPFAGCKKNNTETEPDFEGSQIIKVEAPATAIINQGAAINVYVQGYDGCAKSAQLKEVVNGNTYTIRGKVISEGNICAQVLTQIKTPYIFKVAVPGTYSLKFLTIDNTYLIHTITVN